MSSFDVDLRSVATIARKDFQDAARSKVLWLLTGLFVVFLGGAAFLFVYLDDLFAEEGEEVAAVSLILLLEQPVAWLLPLIGLLVGYKSLAGEVETGSAKILLSLPHSRLDAVLGKFIGRTLVLWASLFAGLLVALVVIVALYDEFNALDLLVFSGLSMLFGAVFVALGVGISATTTSTTRAAVGIVGLFVFLIFVFDTLRVGFHYLLEGTPWPDLGTQPPEWFIFYPRLNPMGAYDAALMGLLPDVVPQAVAQYYPSADVPFYLSGWFAIVLLLAWLAVPLAIGYLRFEGHDL